MGMRPKEHLEMTPYAKYEVFKTAYKRVNGYKEVGDYLAAHVLSFAILEDRVTASYVLAYRYINKTDPSKINELRKMRFKQMIDILFLMGVIDEKLHDKLKLSAERRNELMHEMMWRLNAFNENNVNELRSLINSVEKMTKLFISKK